MRTLTIHNVPDRLHERLAARAAAHRRRPEEEALTVLDEALGAESPDPADILTQLEVLRARSTYRAPPEEIETMIRELRDAP